MHAFSHNGNFKMAVVRGGLRGTSRHSATIILNLQAEEVCAVFETHVHLFRIDVLECIEHRFACDAEGTCLDEQRQCASVTADAELERDG